MPLSLKDESFVNSSATEKDSIVGREETDPHFSILSMITLLISVIRLASANPGL